MTSSLQQSNSFYYSNNGILNPDHHQSLVPPFPERPVNIASYIQPSLASMDSWSPALRRPSSFIAADTSSTYGSCIYTNQNPSLYGYALIQKPYLVPVGTVGTASVYMSCYTATNYGIYNFLSDLFLVGSNDNDSN